MKIRSVLIILALAFATIIPSWAAEEEEPRADPRAGIPALLSRIKRVSVQETLLEEMLVANWARSEDALVAT